MRATFLTLCLVTLMPPPLVWSTEPRYFEDSGIAFSGSLVLDQSQSDLGSRQWHWTTRGLLDLGVTFDLSSLLSLEGGQFYVGYQAHIGRNASDAALKHELPGATIALVWRGGGKKVFAKKC